MPRSITLGRLPDSMSAMLSDSSETSAVTEDFPGSGRGVYCDLPQATLASEPSGSNDNSVVVLVRASELRGDPT
jgi:hypothetical protein